MDDSRCAKSGHQLCLLVICMLSFIIPTHTHGAAAQATTLSIEAIQDLRTTVDDLKAFSKAQKAMNDGIQHSLAVITDKISRLEETVEVLKNEVKQKQSAPLKAENAHFTAIFDETQVNPGPIKFMPSSITAFGSKDGDQRELSANCGSSKWKEDTSTGRCYSIVSDKLGWSDANERCQMEGGQLLSIGSPEEQKFIQGMMKGLHFQYYYIGGRRIQGQLPSSDATGWEWSDGSPFNFTNWDFDQPNNLGGHQECLDIGISGKWYDYGCNDREEFICEKPGIIFTDGVFTAPISGVYELGFTAWSTVNRSIVVIRNNNHIIASALSNSVGMFGTYVIQELKVGEKVAVFLLDGAIDGHLERSATFFGKLVQRI